MVFFDNIKGELNAFKNNGLDNVKIITLVTSLSFIIGIFIIIIFYNLSAIMKFEYLNIKKNFLWIRSIDILSDIVTIFKMLLDK